MAWKEPVSKRSRLVVKLYASGMIRHAPRPNVRDARYSLVNRLWLAQMQTPAVRPDDMGKAEAAPKAKLAPAKRLILPTWMGTDDAGINA